MKEKIEILNNDLINLQQENEEYKRNLNNQKSEKILLMNQVEMLKNTNSSLSKQIVENFNNNKEFYSYNYIEENDMNNNNNNLINNNNTYQINENNNKFIEPLEPNEFIKSKSNNEIGFNNYSNINNFDNLNRNSDNINFQNKNQ